MLVSRKQVVIIWRKGVYMVEQITVPGGFIDLHDHFREPSIINTSENFKSGTAAAVLGGFTHVDDMPNTPGRETWFMDRYNEKTDLFLKSAYNSGGIVAGSQPESDNLADFAIMMTRAIFSKFYMSPTYNNPYDREPSDFQEQLTIQKRVAPDKPAMVHPGTEPENLEAMIAKVCGEFGLRMHACHVNDPRQVDIVTAAKARDWLVTSAVTPHHLAMTSHDSWTRGWYARMVPPLSNQIDAEKLFHQLVIGDIDAIETDHAPHAVANKEAAEQANPTGDAHDHENTCYGVPNIEFAAKLLFYQVKLGRISMERAVDALSVKPAEILGLKFHPGTQVTWDLTKEKIIEPQDVDSAAGWTPFLGMRSVGQVATMTIKGVPIVQNGVLIGRNPAIVTQRGSYV
jgi:dihydroorotase